MGGGRRYHKSIDILLSKQNTPYSAYGKTNLNKMQVYLYYDSQKRQQGILLLQHFRYQV